MQKQPVVAVRRLVWVMTNNVCHILSKSNMGRARGPTLNGAIDSKGTFLIAAKLMLTKLYK
jgi:hypothetical protein